MADNKTDSKEIKYEEFEEFLIFNSDGIEIIDNSDVRESSYITLPLYQLGKIPFGYYAFKLSGNLLSLVYNVDYYIPISSLFRLLLLPISSCKRRSRRIKYNLDDHRITISNIYYRYFSPLRKNKPKHERQLIYGVNELNIQNAWKTYEQEFKEKPKIGDVIEVHYTVPYERKTPHYHQTHTPYIATYVYPCNITFPPYDLETLRGHDREKGYKNGILFASCGDNDLTEKAIQLAGPMGNFYSDLPSRYGIQVPRSMLTEDNNDEELVITDNNAEEYIFKSNSILRI